MGRGNKYYSKDKERLRQSVKRYENKFKIYDEFKKEEKLGTLEKSCDKIIKNTEEMYKTATKVFHGNKNKSHFINTLNGKNKLLETIESNKNRNNLIDFSE